MNRHSVLFHPLQNHSRMKRRSFNCGEQFILRRVGKIPAQCDSAKFRIHEHGSIAIVPCQPQQPRLTSAYICPDRRIAAQWFSLRGAQSLQKYRRSRIVLLRRLFSEDAPIPERLRTLPGITCVVVAHCDDARGSAHDVDDIASASPRSDRVPVRIKRANRNRNALAEDPISLPIPRLSARQSCRWSRIVPSNLARTSFSKGSTAIRKSSAVIRQVPHSTSTCGPSRISTAAHLRRICIPAQAPPRPCRSAQTHWQIFRACLDCSAANAAAWKIPTPTNRCHRTTRLLRPAALRPFQ